MNTLGLLICCVDWYLNKLCIRFIPIEAFQNSSISTCDDFWTIFSYFYSTHTHPLARLLGRSQKKWSERRRRTEQKHPSKMKTMYTFERMIYQITTLNSLMLTMQCSEECSWCNRYQLLFTTWTIIFNMWNNQIAYTRAYQWVAMYNEMRLQCTRYGKTKWSVKGNAATVGI